MFMDETRSVVLKSTPTKTKKDKKDKKGNKKEKNKKDKKDKKGAGAEAVAQKNKRKHTSVGSARKEPAKTKKAPAADIEESSSSPSEEPSPDDGSDLENWE